ncbi:MAG TPA: permease [Gemmatimonadaceae bacterium]|nr:permease [Gemmatimonadaceae bacterium]
MLAIFTRLADWLTYDLLGFVRESRLAGAVHFFIEDTTKIFALLIAIVFAMGLFRSWLSPERVRQLLEGRRRGVMYLLAVMLGAVTPFCSCSSVPLFIGFLEAGIPLGVTMAFLITSPMVNEVAVVLLGSLLGWKLMALYVATGLLVGILGGALIDACKLERYVEDYVWKIRMGEAALPPPASTLGERVRYARGEVREIVGRVWLYVLLGVGVGAGVHGYVPTEYFARYASADNLLAVPLAVLAGIPMYANATGIVPVAEALLRKGVPVGTTLTLMMSVVAISLPEMVILRKVIKPQLIAFFAGFLAVAFTATGYLFNSLLR